MNRPIRKWILPLALAAFIVLLSFLGTASGAGKSHTQDILNQRLSNYQFQYLNADGLLQESLARRPVTFQVQDHAFEVLLEPHDLRGKRYRSAETVPGGEIRYLERSAVRSFRGTLRNQPGQVRVNFVDGTLEALIVTPQEWYFVEPLSHYSDQALKGDMVVYERAAIRAEELGNCGLPTPERLVEGIKYFAPIVADSATSYTVKIATDADYEYVTALGGSANASNGILDILNQVEGVYQSELGIGFDVVFQHTWNTDADPYSATAPATILQEFTNHWNNNFSGVDYDLAHLWTGKDMDGNTVGIAWKGVICTKSFGYGVSQLLTGSSVKSILTAHELGHNFGADHVSSTNPGQGDCGNTIMNPAIGSGFSFCPYSKDQISTHVSQNSSCLLQQQPLAAPTGLVVSPVGSSQLSLSWQYNGSGITGFKIQRKTGSSGTWSEIAQTAVSMKNYVDNGLNASTTYYYRVASTNGTLDSGFSNEANATTPANVVVISSFSPTSGPPGTQVNIEGSGFSGITAVQFASANASYTVVSTSRIVAQVPASTTSGPVRVMTGTSAVSSATNFLITSCNLTISPAAQTLSAAGGAASLVVSAPVGCDWTVTSPTSWIDITTGSSGNGSGTIKFSAAPNSGALSRSGSIVVGGQTASVTQVPTSPGGIETTLFVPIVLSSAGMNGAYFTSEMTLTNRGEQNAVVTLDYSPTFGSGGGVVLDVLAARQQRVIPDAIAYLRSHGLEIPLTGNQGGTLNVQFSGLASITDGAVNVRTTTLVDGGRAGLAYSGVTEAQALTGSAILAGLRQNQYDRSNVAIQNMGSASQGSVTLRVTVYSGDPANPRSFSLPDQVLAPGTFMQFSGILAAGGSDLTNGYVRVERISGNAPFYAYAVINDQLNSDGSFVPAVPDDALAGKSQLTLPAIVEANDFSSELILTNWSSISKTLRCRYVASGITASNSTAEFQLTVLPSQQIIWPDLVQKLRDMRLAGVGPKGPALVGPLVITPVGDDLSGITLAARTSAPGIAGRFGLFYSAVPNGEASSNTAWVYGLLQDGENRTNLAIVNTGEVDSTSDHFRVEIYGGVSGSVVATIEDFTLAPQSWGQLTSILSVYAPGTSQGYAHITRTSGNNPFIAYGVTNDGGQPGQRTGDGAFLLSMP